MTSISSNKIKIKAGLVSCLFFVFGQVNGQIWAFDSTLIRGYDLALAFEFEKSHDIAESYATEPAGIYLLHLNEALKLFLTEDQQDYELFKQKTDQRFEIIEDFDSDPYKGYYLSEMKLHLTFLQIKFGEELSAAWSFRQSYRTMTRNVEAYPSFALNNKTLGIQEVLIGSAPDRHQWLLKVLGFEGSVDEGLKKLTSYSSSASFRKMENDLVLAFIYSHLLQNKNKSLQILNEYQSVVKTQPLVNYALASILSKFSEGEKAYQELADFQPSATAFPFPFSTYLAANLELQREDYLTSANHFKEFLSGYSGTNYIKDANYKIGISYYLTDNQTKSTEWFDKAREVRTAVTEADKYATHAINTVLPDKRLLKVRLATDGGYYERARTILDAIDHAQLTNPRDKIEYAYRYARLLDLTENPDSSIAYYKQAIELTYVDQWYFAPNSALQLGYIYFDKGNLDTAEDYFKLALDYNNHPYQNSIDNKAKAGLSKIKLMRRGD